MAVRKTKAGLALKRWFKEDWKDQRTGKKCGRQKGECNAKPAFVFLTAIMRTLSFFFCLPL